jgi:hypothetical protein
MRNKTIIEQVVGPANIPENGSRGLKFDSTKQVEDNHLMLLCTPVNLPFRILFMMKVHFFRPAHGNYLSITRIKREME